MAELLVRVVSKTNAADVYKDVKLTKRGDVICVQPDGWPWSVEEKTSPAWRIFKMPQETVDSASVLLSPELPAQQDLVVPNPMLQRRGFFINCDHPQIPAALAAYIADDSRVNWFFRIPNQYTIASFKAQRAARSDPAVIG